MKHLFAAIAGLALAGCCPTKAYLDSAKATWGVVGPEYKAYVSSDAKLDDASKTTRTRTADLLTKMLEEATK